jgi:hypothetical protein
MQKKPIHRVDMTRPRSRFLMRQVHPAQRRSRAPTQRRSPAPVATDEKLTTHAMPDRRMRDRAADGEGARQKKHKKRRSPDGRLSSRVKRRKHTTGLSALLHHDDLTHRLGARATSAATSLRTGGSVSDHTLV